MASNLLLVDEIMDEIEAKIVTPKVNNKIDDMILNGDQ
jgi:hypothetical protein